MSRWWKKLEAQMVLSTHVEEIQLNEKIIVILTQNDYWKKMYRWKNSVWLAWTKKIKTKNVNHKIRWNPLK